MINTLKQKAISGIFWTTLQRFSTIFIQFISGIILARLLTPYDYGCIGMLTIFMTLAQVFIDGGFGSALIQKKQPTQLDYSSIFWWNVGMAVLMYAVLFVCAPAIAQFYHIPQLSDVLRVQGIILFIYAFNIIQRNQLQKKLNFKQLSIVTITTSIVSLFVTIWMAYMEFGVWALVSQNLITAAIPALVFWFTVKWRPVFAFSKKSFRELFSFGFYIFLTHSINEFCRQIQGLLIGKVYNPSTLGYYSKADTTERLVSSSISQIMLQVTYPLYAEAQDNKAVLSNMIKQITTTLAYVTFPMLFILLLCTKPIFVLLYSDRWVQSVPYFQVLCMAGLAYCLQSVNLQAVAAIGKSKTMLKWTIVKRVIGLGLVIGGLALYGMKGLLCGTVLYNWFAYFVNMWLVSKHIGYKWWIQLKHLSPIMFVALIATAISYAVGHILSFPMYLNCIVVVVVYLGIYIGWSVVLKPSAFIYFQGIMYPMMQRFVKTITHNYLK